MKRTQRWITTVLIGVMALLMADPAMGQDRRSYTTTKDGNDVRYTWVDGDDKLEVRLRGEVAFTDDDAGIASISDDGRLTIDERTDRRRRELDVRPGADGTPRYTYRVNGREQAYDAAARRDMADLILLVIRETAWNAEARVARILREGGPGGVFDEIDQIRRSHANSRYLSELLHQGKLNTAQLRRYAREVPEQVPSSGDRSRLLIEAAPFFVRGEAPTAAYFDAVDTLPSSGDHARVLTHLLDEHRLTGDDLVMLLHSARTLPSSGDKARVLIRSVPLYANDPAIRSAFFDAVDAVASSGDRTRVLKALLDEHPTLDAASTTALFRSAEGIPSSGDRSALLVHAAPQFVDDVAQRDAFFDAVDSIPSSGDHARVLLALLDHDDLSAEALRALLHSVTSISSSGDKARVLVAAAGPVSRNDTLVDAYLEAAETISSSSDHSRALTALVRAE